MYETLMMLKPGKKFTPDEMVTIVREISSSGDGEFESRGDSCVIRAGDAYLQIDYCSAAHIKKESEKIAEQFRLSCAACVTRYEMKGYDPDGLLFNDYLLINEKLYATGKFVIFDQVEGKGFTA